MSSDQPTLSDFGTEQPEQTANARLWKPQGSSEQTTNHSCVRCGTSVSPSYHRKNRDERTGKLHGCQSCYQLNQLIAGAHQKDNDGDSRLRGSLEGSK